MKKLFLSLLALVAMVVTANAQRAWAYDLSLTSESESYTFTFKATTAATATLILSDEEGNNVGTLDLGAVVAGSNTFTYTTDQLPKAGKMNWAVKLTGGAVVEEVALKELNSTLFYNMMGIVADVNPESDHFGKVYMQMSYDGKPTYGTTKQTQGFFIFDPIFNLISTPNIGIKPTLPSGYTLDGTNRLQFHRVAIDPKTGNLAFCYSIADKPGVFSIGRNNLTGEVTNLLAGVTGVENIKRTNALCFDKDGALYIIADVTTASTTGNIYKILDGVATKLTLKGKKIWIDEQVGLVSDGRGGLWVAQNRSGITANSAVFHVNIAKDTIDFVLETDKDYSDWFAGGNGNNCRGGIAYNVKENILATHSQGAKVSLFKVTYDEETGIPTIKKWLQGATGGKNTDAIAFDYAGDLYTGNSSGEYFKKFAVPTSDNTFVTPAPKAQVITLVSSKKHTITVAVTPAESGIVEGLAANGIYEEGDKATLTAKANKGYEFVNWTVANTEVSKDATYTFDVKENVALVANFAAVEPEPVVMTGIVKRALQNGENVIVLTHEADGTPHIYNIVKGEAYEVSQEGVVARDLENKGDYLSISDIAVTDDGKLVACNYIRCQNADAQVDAGYKRGTNRFYIWDELTGGAKEWFTEQFAGNSYRADAGYTMALKGSSTDCNILVTVRHYNNAGAGGSDGSVRMHYFTIAGGAKPSRIYLGSTINSTAPYYTHTIGENMLLSASPLATKNFIMDADLTAPSEFKVGGNGTDVTILGRLDAEVVTTKFNGVSYVTYDMKTLAVAPYADAEGKLAGVKVIDVTTGFATAQVVKVVDLNTPIAATAAATAVAVEENGLTITLVADAEVHTLTVDLNLKPTTYTVTATANIAERGYIEGLTNEGVYEAGTKVTLRAVANEGYEFVKWNIDNKIVGLEEEYTFTVTADVEIVAHFKKSGVVEIIGIVKRALQNGENVIILTHEPDATPHIYNIAGETITEVSQEGVVACDPENLGDYLSISDIALTDDGKLVACNYIRCQSQYATPETGYKRGTSIYYIWNDIAAAPIQWFTSQQTANSNHGDVGYTFAVKGVSTNAQVMTTAVHNSNRAARINLHTIVNGVEETSKYHRFGLHTTDSYFTEAKRGVQFQLSTTPLDGIWAMDGDLANPAAFTVPSDKEAGYDGIELPAEAELGKKYNGASYVKYNEEALMVAPYADAEGKLAGVKVIDITAGFDAATEVKVANLAAAVEAATAATAVKVVENGLTVTLVGDATLYTLNVELTQDPGPGTAIDNTVVAPQVEKIVRNGQVLIIRDGRTFNMMGQEVK